LRFTIKTKDEAYRLEASVQEIGRDLLIAIWGGDRPHIGAVAVAQPRPSLKDQSVLSATASVFCYPGHKDDIIAKEAAEKVSSALNRHVTVTVGIHWDDIDETGITAVIANSQQLMNMIIEKIAAMEGT
jgi:hypothetical protein